MSVFNECTSKHLLDSVFRDRFECRICDDSTFESANDRLFDDRRLVFQRVEVLVDELRCSILVEEVVDLLLHQLSLP